MCMSLTRNDAYDGQGEVLAVTVAEAARRLGVSRTTVYELVGQGKIRRVRVGNSPRITVAELKRFVEALEFENFDSFGPESDEATRQHLRSVDD